MALFPWQQPQQIHRRPIRPAVRQPQPRAELPAFMHRLNGLCHDHSHPLPVALVHIGDITSDRGQPMAVYACPLCGTREGWVVDFRTGKPWRLWVRRAERQHS